MGDHKSLRGQTYDESRSAWTERSSDMSKCENPTDRHIKRGIVRNMDIGAFASVALLRSRFGYAYMPPTRADVTQGGRKRRSKINIGISER